MKLDDLIAEMATVDPNMLQAMKLISDNLYTITLTDAINAFDKRVAPGKAVFTVCWRVRGDDVITRTRWPVSFRAAIRSAMARMVMHPELSCWVEWTPQTGGR